MTALLIAVIAYFALSLALSLINIGLNANEAGKASQVGASFINVLISLGFITWSIILLVN